MKDVHEDGSDGAVLSSTPREGIVHLELNRSEKRNALNTSLLEQMLAELKAAEAAQATRVVVLSARGKVFSAGGDLSEFNAEEGGSMKERAALMVQVFTALKELRVPVIAVCDGAALGAGVALALSADYVLASSHFSIRLPELQRGIVPSLVMASIVHHFGERIAMDLILTGRAMAVEEAYRLGGISLLAEGRVFDTAMSLAQRVVEYDASVVAEAKSLLYRQSVRDLGAAYELGLHQG